MKKFIGVLMFGVLVFGLQPIYSINMEQVETVANSYEHPLLLQADSLYAAGEEEGALAQYALAAEYFVQEEHWREYVIARSGQLKALIKLDKYDELKDVYQEALILGTTKLGKDHPDLARLYLHYGHFLYEVKGDYEAAEIALKEALELIKGVYPVTHQLSIAIYYQFTYFYKYYKGDDYTARSYLKVLIDNTQALDERQLAFSYYTMASISREMDDFEKAEIYAIKALEAYGQIPNINLGFAYTVLGNVYQEQQNFEKANDNYEMAIDILKADYGPDYYGLTDIYLNELLNYTTLGQHDTAIEIGQEALRVLDINDALNSENARIIYLNMGIALVDNRQLEQALIFTRQSLDLLLNESDYADPDDVAKLYGAIGDIYVGMDMFDSSMLYFQRAISVAYDDIRTENIFYTPPAAPFLNNRVYHDIIYAKAYALLKEGEQESSSALLKAALEYYLLLDDVTTHNRLSFERDGSELFLLDRTKSNYEEAIHCAYLLYELSGDQNYLDHIQYFFEASKSRMLFETVNESDEFALLPDSLAEMSKQLAIDYNYQRRLRQEVDISEDIDSVFLNSINQRIFEISQTQERLEMHIAQEYPYIKSSKEELGLIALNDVKEYSKDRQVIEFFWGESSVYLMSVSSGHVRFKEVRIDTTLTEHLENLSTILRAAVPDPFDQQAFKSFHESAYFLYQHLLEPIIQSDQMSMLVIPDGPLNSIPFEALISSPYQNNDINYKSLDYLINTYEIGYDHSLSLAFNEITNSRIIEDPRILALGFSSEEDVEVAKSTGPASIELPGTAQEISAISGFIGEGDYLLGYDASEAYFIEHGADYDILHLAIHGIGDEQHRLGSKLIFKSTSQGYDSLYAYEMFNMNLQAKLAVLSACETGVGKLQKGEGVFNLARGFTYAGCPSVVMSLWKINDAVSAELMSSFYKDLVNGNDIDKSLRTAKLRYLNEADRFSAHPSQWAAFVHFGPQNSFDVQLDNRWVIWGSIFLGIMVLSWAIVRLRTKEA